MNTRLLGVAIIAMTTSLSLAGCGRQTRGNADAQERSRAATPEEGGNASTAGSAGQARNFGDTSRSGASEAVTPPDVPKQNDTPASNEPANQPLKSTRDGAQKTP